MSGIEPNPVSKRACVSHWRRVWYLEPKWLRCLLYLSVRVGQDYKFTAPKKNRPAVSNPTQFQKGPACRIGAVYGTLSQNGYGTYCTSQ